MFVTATYAAPVVSSVSGKLEPGQALTISGTGFGTKSTAAPLLFDTFESGSNGASVGQSSAVVGKWDSGSGSELVKYSTASPRSGKVSTLHDFKQSYNISLAKNGSFPTLYMSFWFKVDLADRRSRNFKLWRLYGDNDRLQMAWVYMCDSIVLSRQDDNAGFAQNFWNGQQYTPGQWHHVQLVMKESDPSVANGTIQHFIDSKSQGSNSTAVQTRYSQARFSQLRIGHYWATDAIDSCSSSTGAKVYIDDVYVDTSWARVELGNASTYAQSTQREVLVPTSWGGSKVEVTVPVNGFTAGQTAYLYVTDQNNVTQSAGFPVVVGAGAGQKVPQPPSAVQVQ